MTGSIQNQNNPVGKGSNNTTYAQAYIRTGTSATSYLTYGFDLSDIPDNAVINSVSCSAKGYISTTGSNAIRTRQMQMFSGDTAKGTASTISNTASVITMSVGTWTVAELKNARIRIYAVRGTSSTSSSVYLRFYGATLTVVYEYNDKRYLIKTGASQWSEVSKVYEKTSSGMVERNLETVMTAIQDGKKMRYAGIFAGESATTHTVSVNLYISGTTTSTLKPYITVNGQKVTTQGTYQVAHGGVITASFDATDSGSNCVVAVNGTEVARGTSDYLGGKHTFPSYNYTVDSDATITVTDDGKTDCTIHIRT